MEINSPKKVTINVMPWWRTPSEYAALCRSHEDGTCPVISFVVCPFEEKGITDCNKITAEMWDEFLYGDSNETC